jgi:hypothetical protein
MKLIHENKMVDTIFPFLEYWIENGEVTEVLVCGQPLSEEAYSLLYATAYPRTTIMHRVHTAEEQYPKLIAEQEAIDAEEEDAIKYAKEICR